MPTTYDRVQHVLLGKCRRQMCASLFLWKARLYVGRAMETDTDISNNAILTSRYGCPAVLASPHHGVQATRQLHHAPWRYYLIDVRM